MRLRLLPVAFAILVAAVVAGDEPPLTGFTPARARAPRALEQRFLAAPRPGPPRGRAPTPPRRAARRRQRGRPPHRRVRPGNFPRGGLAGRARRGPRLAARAGGREGGGARP